MNLNYLFARVWELKDGITIRGVYGNSLQGFRLAPRRKWFEKLFSVAPELKDIFGVPLLAYNAKEVSNTLLSSDETVNGDPIRLIYRVEPCIDLEPLKSWIWEKRFGYRDPKQMIEKLIETYETDKEKATEMFKDAFAGGGLCLMRFDEYDKNGVLAPYHGKGRSYILLHGKEKIKFKDFLGKYYMDFKEEAEKLIDLSRKIGSRKIGIKRIK